MVSLSKLNCPILSPQVCFPKNPTDNPFTFAALPVSSILTIHYWEITSVVQWNAFRQSPSLGRQTSISWIFAQNRLAILCHLCRSKLHDTNVCWVYCGVENWWSIMVTCRRAKYVWDVVRGWVWALMGRDLTDADIYCGLDIFISMYIFREYRGPVKSF